MLDIKAAFTFAHVKC